MQTPFKVLGGCTNRVYAVLRGVQWNIGTAGAQDKPRIPFAILQNAPALVFDLQRRQPGQVRPGGTAQKNWCRSNDGPRLRQIVPPIHGISYHRRKVYEEAEVSQQGRTCMVKQSGSVYLLK